MVAGRSSAPENIPHSTEITVKSTMLMLSNPRRMQKALAANARKIDIIMVRIMAEMMFWFKTGDFFSSGVKVPIWRFEPNLEPNAPNMFPLIPIAPGIRTRSPGSISRVLVIPLSRIPAIKSPIAHIKRAVNVSPKTRDTSLKKLVNLLLMVNGTWRSCKDLLETKTANLTIKSRMMCIESPILFSSFSVHFT